MSWGNPTVYVVKYPDGKYRVNRTRNTFDYAVGELISESNIQKIISEKRVDVIIDPVRERKEFRQNQPSESGGPSRPRREER